MSVTSAMFTGVSGLLANAEGINVIGNNLANVNTVGFKSGRMLFSDMLSANIGNGSQVGRGIQIQKVDNIFSQGSFETTESVTDLALQGNSFFAVMDPNAIAPVNQNGAMLTRAGAFSLDSNLNLVNPDGYQVLDTQGNPIKFSDNAVEVAAATAAIIPAATTASTINTQAAAQLTAAGTFTTAVYTAAAAAYNTQAGTLTAASPAVGSANTLVAAVAGGTPVEIAAASAIKTDADAARTAATAANTAPFTAVKVAAAQAAFATLTATTLANSATLLTNFAAAYNSFNTNGVIAANNANATNAPPAQITAANAINTAATAAQAAATAAVITPGLATNAAAQAAFNALNTLTNGSTFTIPAAVTGAYTTFKTGLNTANTTVNIAISDAAAALTRLATAQGLAFNKITSIGRSGLITYLGKDGITTNYYNTSGQVGLAANAANAATVQRLAVVTVTNPGGLEKAGGTLFNPTTASGISSTAFSLANNSANGSSEKIYTNSLEQSNVDMASQLVKMILTQRAYSANSKTITTADEMTQEALNLKR